MKTLAWAILTVMLAAAAFGAAGDTIRSFTLVGLPDVRGLAYDAGDNSVWAAGPFMSNLVKFGRFEPTSASVLSSWTEFPSAFWNHDLGYGYVIDGQRRLVAVDGHTPRIRVYATTGSFLQTLPDPFTGGYDAGLDCDWGGVYIFATNYSFTPIMRWDGGAWAAWADVPATPPRGLATGWGRVFVVTDSPDYKIYEFTNIYGSSGSLTRSIPLNNWGTRHVAGMGLGRVNAVGGEETLFVAVFDMHIYEISIGDVTDAAVAPASLGKVKALFE